MDKLMNVEIISPKGVEFSGTARSVRVPATKGEFQLLNMHAAIVSTLTAGKVVVERENGEKVEFEVKGGLIQNRDNKIAILTDN